MSAEDFLKAKAQELGFDACRMTRADEPWAASERLEAYVAEGRHGSMEWMEITLERRKIPTAMWAEAKSAVVVGLNYGPDHDPMMMLERVGEGNISVYARGKDYHDILKKRLKQLARAFVEETGEDVKVFVDTAPLMEKPLAAKSGMGWQGKHTNLVSRELGSWLFLGVMLTTAELTPDKTEVDHCGSCSACLDICPTKAFPAPYQLDARRCISYLTIEYKEPIPHEYREAMGNRIYGCDDCQLVCPWNRFSEITAQEDFHRREAFEDSNLVTLFLWDEETFLKNMAGSAIRRIGHLQWLRNLSIAMGNAPFAQSIVDALQTRIGLTEILDEHIHWALAQQQSQLPLSSTKLNRLIRIVEKGLPRDA